MKSFNLYLCEALGLGVFMFSAGFFCVLIDHPDFLIRDMIHSDLIRRFLIGLSMGLTALFIIHSPFGKKSGAQINPAVTITFWRLGRMNARDTFFYCLFQFIGGTLGMYLISMLMPHAINHPYINHIVTIPGAEGFLGTFVAEFLISFFLILTVLYTSDRPKLAPYTSYFVATLITLYITFEAPFSGMSMNPARTFASSFVANVWTGLWIYFTAPVLAMLSAGEIGVSSVKNKIIY